MTARLLAAFAALDLVSRLLPRRPRPVDPFAAHVLPQKWLDCEDHGFVGFTSSLEPGCGCTPDSP